MSSRLTDFEEFGLSLDRLELSKRLSLLTVDFEAFRPEHTHLWVAAMSAWGVAAEQAGLPFSLFVSIEDLAQLRQADDAAYARFATALAEMSARGTRLYPHNHRVFDPSSGEILAPLDIPEVIPGYRNRASMYYNVVHALGMSFTAWIGEMTTYYKTVLSEMGVQEPDLLAFRPGGWDHGSDVEELRDYLSALAQHRYVFDSSAVSGRFGEHDWRVGAPFGRNLFALRGGLIEAAPTWTLHCGVPTASPRSAASMVRLLSQPPLLRPRRGGLAVCVLHFDHLFHRGRGRTYRPFSVTDRAEVEARVRRAIRNVALLNRALLLRPIGFDDLYSELDRTPSPPDASLTRSARF